jgi:ABC-type multidrug transport system ATPase subunit
MAGTILEARNLTKKFKNLTAVDSISFSVEKSEIFGVVGPNGAGKTTTIKVLTTLLPPTSGEAMPVIMFLKTHQKYEG